VTSGRYRDHKVTTHFAFGRFVGSCSAASPLTALAGQKMTENKPFVIS
jgi:hypothetical protein